MHRQLLRSEVINGKEFWNENLSNFSLAIIVVGSVWGCTVFVQVIGSSALTRNSLKKRTKRQISSDNLSGNGRDEKVLKCVIIVKMGTFKR
jgi:hypothetical protein